MLLLLWAALLADEGLPEPIAQWEISYVPAFAMLDEAGNALVLDQSGLVAYHYDSNGQLRTSFTLATAALAGYRAPDGSPILSLAGNLLAGLNANGSLRWQRELNPPVAPPQSFAKYMVYAENDRVMLIDPQEGSTRFSLQHTRPIVAAYVFEDRIWISDDSGNTMTWEPFSEARQPRFSQRRQYPIAAQRSADGSSIRISDNGLVETLRPDGRASWRRNFQIDFAAPPLLLAGKERKQLVLATMGRNLLILDAKGGDLLARKLLLRRPRALVPFGSTRALVIVDQARELFWYHAPSGQFTSKPLTSTIDQVAASETYLLLLADDGTMRLFKK